MIHGAEEEGPEVRRQAARVGLDLGRRRSAADHHEREGRMLAGDRRRRLEGEVHPLLPADRTHDEPHAVGVGETEPRPEGGPRRRVRPELGRLDEARQVAGTIAAQLVRDLGAHADHPCRSPEERPAPRQRPD